MIKYGFQTYTWQMSYEKYADKIEHIIDLTKQSEMHAIEPDTSMLKGFFDNPEAFKKVLADKGIELASLCVVCDWLNNGETAEEKQFADKAINFAKAFPNPMLLLVQMPQNDRNNLAERQKNALTCIHDVATRAAGFGVKSVFHPNSPPGSIFRTADDYKLMFDRLDSKYVAFAADSGHIINGGMDVYDLFRDYMSVIKHVHFKDIDPNGGWKIMGEGITDFAKITQMLHSSGYNGYIIVEDESPEAEDDPDMVTIKNAKYIRDKLFPIK
jgi:inosose dehydratase